jgi:hypothetical protein
VGPSFLCVLVIARVGVLWNRPVAWSAWPVVGYFWQDALVALLFIGLSAVMRRRPFGARAVSAMYWGIILYTAVNVAVFRVLSTPLTWPMWRAARGAISDSILFHVTPTNVFLLSAIAGAAALLPRVFRHAARGARIGTVVLAGGLVAVGWVAESRIDAIGLHRHPLVTLAAGAWPRVSARAAAGAWTTPPFESPLADDMSHLRGRAAGRNVVLVSLESTGAQYLRLYDGSYDLTPNLDRLAQHAAVFESAYAVTPESIKGLYSVLCSRYPAFETPAQAYGSTPCRSLASELAGAGYRTALFHSGRFAYLGMNAVVQGRGFEVLEDAGTIGGNHESSFGVDEPATVSRMLAWIDSLSKGERFFLTYLPIAGHHPYATPERGPFPDRDDIGRYRNAIRHGDASLGALIDGLRARGLEQQTLWIIYGDHGQAFGQHDGNYGHTFFLYEENVRVPFIVAAPGAIDRTERSRTTISLVDVAPTMLDLLGLPIPAERQGQSALDGPARMALFFTDYSLSLAGLRDGRWKLVHDLTSGRSKLFDLERDPSERANVAPDHPARVAEYERRLNAWAAAQKAMMERPPDPTVRGSFRE